MINQHKLHDKSLIEFKVAMAYKKREKHVGMYAAIPINWVSCCPSNHRTQTSSIASITQLEANLTSPTSLCLLFTYIPQGRIIIHPQNMPASRLSFSPHFPSFFFFFFNLGLCSYGGFSLFQLPTIDGFPFAERVSNETCKKSGGS